MKETRFKAHFFLNPDNKKQEQERIIYEPEKRHYSPQRTELEEFKTDVFSIVESIITFRSVSDKLQKKVRLDKMKR